MKWYNDDFLMITVVLICSIGGCVSCHKIDRDYEIERLKLETKTNKLTPNNQLEN